MSRHSESLWRLERWRQKRETPVAEAGTEDINDYVSENGPFRPLEHGNAGNGQGCRWIAPRPHAGRRAAPTRPKARNRAFLPFLGGGALNGLSDKGNRQLPFDR
jgi:hypothetical protein